MILPQPQFKGLEEVFFQEKESPLSEHPRRYKVRLYHYDRRLLLVGPCHLPAGQYQWPFLVRGGLSLRATWAQ